MDICEKMEKAVSVGSVPFPLTTTIRRLLVWGVPSLAFLGLVGIAGWRWFSRRKTNRDTSPGSVATTTIPAACCRCESACSSSTTDHSPTSVDSGVVDESSQGYMSGKASEENLHAKVAPAPFKILSNLNANGKQLTSSNLSLPLLETETPIKPQDSAAGTSSHIPPINHESFSEMDSTSSSEGLLSMPGKSPSDGDPTILPPQQQKNRAELCNLKKEPSMLSNMDVQHQPKTESKRESSMQESEVSPVVNRKERVRVMIQIPREVVGRFIGKQGRNIKALMTDSDGAHVYVNQKNLPKDAEAVLCTVQGTSVQVEDAMKIIEAKYPEINIPASPGTSSAFLQASPLLSPHFGTPKLNTESWEVELLPAFIPPTSFSAMVCYIENLMHVWLVACEKSVELDEQHQSMSYTYCYAVATGNDRVVAKEKDSSLLGKFCAVRVSEIHWLRGRVMRFGDDLAHYEVQLMDYGSVVVVPPTAIKPLRREHCQLPVQAFKARLAHVEVKDASVSDTGLVALQKMVDGMMLEVHITGKIYRESSEGAKENNEGEGAKENDEGDGVKECNEREGLATASSLDTSAKNEPELSSPPPLSTPGGSEALTSQEAAASPPCPKEASIEPPPMTPCVPLVELYTQLGAQTPTFINRELVELGYASWKEGSEKSS